MRQLMDQHGPQPRSATVWRQRQQIGPVQAPGHGHARLIADEKRDISANSELAGQRLDELLESGPSNVMSGQAEIYQTKVAAHQWEKAQRATENPEYHGQSAKGIRLCGLL